MESLEDGISWHRVKAQLVTERCWNWGRCCKHPEVVDGGALDFPSLPAWGVQLANVGIPNHFPAPLILLLSYSRALSSLFQFRFIHLRCIVLAKMVYKR